MNKLFAASILALAVAYPTTAQTPPFDTPAPIAYLEDLSSGAVLYAKDADRRIPPASMAKMMTVYVAFDLIKQGKLKLTTADRSSPETWKKWHSQGSTMFLAVGENPHRRGSAQGHRHAFGQRRLRRARRGIAGTEEAFVNLMNQQAKKLGLTNSHFGNSNGWPDEGRTYVTARDLAHLAKATIQDHPQLYKQFYSCTSYTWGKTLGAGEAITQGNRDPLLGRVQGADGLKTGHTDEAGYGFTGSAEQNGRRLVMVVAGLEHLRPARRGIGALHEVGLPRLEPATDRVEGQEVGEVEVQGGGSGSVGVVAPRDLNATVPAGTSPAMTGQTRLSRPGQGADQGGAAHRRPDRRDAGHAAQTLPVVAEADVGEAGFFRRVWLG
jgi:D-alanyl-D-alanine carboxypeptidase (penicillin-binding protein 5/6)